MEVKPSSPMQECLHNNQDLFAETNPCHRAAMVYHFLTIREEKTMSGRQTSTLSCEGKSGCCSNHQQSASLAHWPLKVIFNNSLQNQGDLLVRLPFYEGWTGVFELTIEAWHVKNPKKIPKPVMQTKKIENKSIYASILETITTQLTKTEKFQIWEEVRRRYQ